MQCDSSFINTKRNDYDLAVHWTECQWITTYKVSYTYEFINLAMC